MMKRSAFTMLEMVFVIVVLGILASMAMPRFERDIQQEAQDNILSAIRYTQHLALIDDKQKFDNKKWQRRFWRIVFSTCTGDDKFYMIGSDDDMTGSDNAFFEKDESALDPQTGKPIFWTNGTDCSDGGDNNSSNDIFLSKKYGIKDISSSGGCDGATHIAFDHLGRPFHGADFSNADTADSAGYMSQECTFTFTLSDDSTFSIKVLPETGYSYIEGQENS
jgi:prepilin-type N-terminal cleavage/methylation domain-containing protein